MEIYLGGLKMSKLIIGTLCFILMFSGLCCTILSHKVTPAEIDEQAVEYAVEAGAAEPNEYTGYKNLAKAIKLVEDVDAAHQLVQFDLNHLIEKDNLDYSLHTETVTANQSAALQREEMLFGETGLLSMGLSMIGVGGFTGVLGLMRRKPGDISPDDAEKAIAQATGKTQEELSEKTKQMIQLVKGVQQFMDTYDDPKAVSSMKATFNAVQDTSTKKAVAEIKIS